MELGYDPVTSLRHWPTPMSRFGKTPFGDNLYRIVFRESRLHLVGGRWAGEGDGYHWVPKYRNHSAAWILERWRPEPMTKREWDTQLVDPLSGWLLLGPYPSRGDYELVWEFDYGVDADSLDRIVGFVENERKRRTAQDLRDRVANDYSQEQKESSSNSYMEIRDAMTAFGGAPMVAGNYGRGTKTRDPILTANELGMPIPKALPNGRGTRIGDLELSNSLSTGVRI